MQNILFQSIHQLSDLEAILLFLVKAEVLKQVFFYTTDGYYGIPDLGIYSSYSREDVDFTAVKLAQEQWDYKEEGLTPAAAALISIALTMATNGAGASMLKLFKRQNVGKFSH